MPQHYIKIEIKGESDLPEHEIKDCWVVTKDRTVYKSDFDLSSKTKENWVRSFFMYFLPVPEPQQPERPESAELTDRNKCIKMGCIDIEKDLWININCLNHITPATCGRELSCEICEKYIPNASQSHSNTVGPSETEISAMLDKANYDTSKEREMAYDLIKYALSQCKAIDIKQIEKQLIDRFGFTDGVVNVENQVKIFSFIDWLKSPENK